MRRLHNARPYPLGPQALLVWRNATGMSSDGRPGVNFLFELFKRPTSTTSWSAVLGSNTGDQGCGEFTPAIPATDSHREAVSTQSSASSAQFLRNFPTHLHVRAHAT